MWNVEYNAENRPVRWMQGNKVVTMDFDRMGRRIFYREMDGDVQLTYTKFFYNGYLCIMQLFSDDPPDIYKEFIWDPTEPVATRPLCFREYYQMATFLMHDGNKNVTDVVTVGPDNEVVGHYDYAPFGAITSQTGSRASANPFRFSSEFHDDTLGLVYYNYRHYNPQDGRWCGRDPIGARGGINLFEFMLNIPNVKSDYLGLREEEIDCKKCTYTLIFRVAFIYFDNKSRDLSATLEQMSNDFNLYFEQSLLYKRKIEQIFNTNKFKIYSNNELIKKCRPNGLRPLLRITTQLSGSDPDNVDFFLNINRAQKGEKDRASANFLYREMNVWVDDFYSNRSTLAHEFGHILGLHHPGDGVNGNIANSREEYDYTGKDRYGRDVSRTDLMGTGEDLREFYFDQWKDLLEDENP